MKILPIDASKDLTLVEQVIEKAFGSTPDSQISDWFSFDEMAKSITEDRGMCLKAIDDDGNIVGMIHAQVENPINGREGKEKWVITNTGVIPESTGKGVGTQLLKEIEKVAKDHGAKKIYVHTNDGDERVIHFYRSVGYKDAGSIKDYYYAGSAVFLMKQL